MSMPEFYKNKIQTRLAYLLLYKAGFRIIAVVLIMAIISAWYLKKSNITNQLDFLESYTKQKNQTESFLFQHAVKDVEFINHQIEQILAHDNISRLELEKHKQTFQHLFEISPDGALRSIKSNFNAEKEPSVISTKNTLFTDIDKYRVIKIWENLAGNNVVWTKRYINTWIVYKGKTSLALAPKKPNVIYETEADFEDGNEDYYTITDAENNPNMLGKWTDLYFDPNFKSWMISYTTPIKENGKKIGVTGVDIFLEELFSQIINIRLDGSESFILTTDGRIILHPKYLDQIKNSAGQFSINQANDQTLNAAQALIKNLEEQNTFDKKKKYLFEHQQSLFGLGKIPETNWYVVTYYPAGYLGKNSQTSFLILSILTLLYLIIELFIMYLTIKKDLETPLHRFIEKIRNIKNLDQDLEFPIERKDEIGVLARSFTTLQNTLKIRNKKLKEYTENLEIIVQERTNKLEKTLHESQESLERSIQSAKLATLGEVASGLSHELNSPIMVLKGTAHQIEKGITHQNLTLERLNHLIQRLQGTTKKMTDSVNSLRIFSRNPIHDLYSETNLYRIMQSALTICREKFRFHQIEIRFNEDQFKTINLQCKETQITHAILNLLNNSFDSIINRPIKWIEVSAKVENNQLHLTVTDSGSPITDDIAEKMFTPYFTTRYGQNRAGLGLCITQKIIQDHFGKIQFTKKQQINHFEITLPLTHNNSGSKGDPVGEAR